VLIKNPKTTAIFGALLVASFFLGMYVYKQGYHYEVFSFYYDKYRKSPDLLKFVLPEDMVGSNLLLKTLAVAH
jgi:hypothetical protein